MVKCIGVKGFLVGGRGRNRTSHATTSLKFSKRGTFYGTKNERSKAGGLVLLVTRIFLKGKTRTQVKKFYKCIKSWRRGKQISATQTYHAVSKLVKLKRITDRAAPFPVPPRFLYFFEKIAILMLFRSHFAYFQSHLKIQTFCDLKAN